MIVSSVRITLRIDGAFSLKDKRQVVRKVADRLRNRLGLCVAEVGDQELWNSCELGICTVGSDPEGLGSILDQAVNQIEDWGIAQVVSIEHFCERY